MAPRAKASEPVNPVQPVATEIQTLEQELNQDVVSNAVATAADLDMIQGKPTPAFVNAIEALDAKSGEAVKALAKALGIVAKGTQDWKSQSMLERVASEQLKAVGIPVYERATPEFQAALTGMSAVAVADAIIGPGAVPTPQRWHTRIKQHNNGEKVITNRYGHVIPNS